MPLYEFKCLACNDVFELLVMSKGDEVEMSCPNCKSETFERVMSKTNFAMGIGSGESGPKAQSRTCSSGSCTTIELPGHSR